MQISKSIRRDARPFAGEIVVLHRESRPRAWLAGYKALKSARFIDEIPQIATGKLLRRAPRQALWAGRERRL